jgi:hypothetical protein
MTQSGHRPLACGQLDHGPIYLACARSMIVSCAANEPEILSEHRATYTTRHNDWWLKSSFRQHLIHG